MVDAKGVVQQVTNYYPFGAPYADASASKGANILPYKYNGKEFDRMHGLNTYDYGARQYNPVTGRWDRMDPHCESYYNASPYVYANNNPVMLVDLDGMDWILSTGDKVFWYGGEVGDDSKLLYTFNATSGNIVDRKDGGQNNYQEARFQNIKDKGPTPEGDYHINLEPDPDRQVETFWNNGNIDFKKREEGGIETLTFPNPTTGTLSYSPAWGMHRAALTPDNVTGAKDSERDNSSYYFHDSTKGYTHGCTEVDTELFSQLKDYRNAGNTRIDVVVKYNDPHHKTNGGTKK